MTVAESDLSPKVDFYEFVNKKWLQENPIPDEYSNWGGFTILHDEGLKNQIQLVKDLGKKQDRNDYEEKIYAIWVASNARFEKWAQGGGNVDAISKELKGLDEKFGIDNATNVKMSDVTDEVYVQRVSEYLYYAKTNGIGNCVDFDKGPDLTNANNVLLDFSTCGLSLPSREYYTEETFAEKRDLFKKHLENVCTLVIAKDDSLKETLGENFVDNVLDFEKNLAKFSMKREHSREYDRYFTNTNLVDLYEKIDDLNFVSEKLENYDEAEKNFTYNEKTKNNVKSLMEQLYTKFDFRKILADNCQKNFVEAKVENGPDVEQITAYDGDGIKRVLALITNKDNFVKYRSYMQYKTLKKFHGYCTKDMDEEFFDFYSRKLNGQEKQKENDKRSMSIVNAFAGELMGKVYVDKYFPPQSKVDVKSMISEALLVMKESLKTNDWLTEGTKAKAMDKLAKFHVKIGYPDVWKDYSEFVPVSGDSLYDISKKATQWDLKNEFFKKLNSVIDRTEWGMTPQTVNAYFNPCQNEIVFPAAIFQPPFYHQSTSTLDFDVASELKDVDPKFAIRAANFGGIGAVINHEITHGYDDKGRKFDGDGNLNDWWNEDDATLFKGKTDIMAAAVERYEYIDVEDDNKSFKMNAFLTMGENLADLGGLSLSLKSLLKALAEAKQDDAAIRASIRILFKSWANVWKQNIKKDSRINRLTTDPHAPCEFRANLVNHMSEFYESFDVAEGDAMYIKPEARVRMW